MEINQGAERLVDSDLETLRLGQAEGSIRVLNSRAIYAIRADMFKWRPKWLRPEGAEARERCAGERANLTALGLPPLDAPPG